MSWSSSSSAAAGSRCFRLCLFLSLDSSSRSLLRSVSSLCRCLSLSRDRDLDLDLCRWRRRSSSCPSRRRDDLDDLDLKRNLVGLVASVSRSCGSGPSSALSSFGGTSCPRGAGRSGVIVRSRLVCLGASSSAFVSGGLMEDRMRRRLGERGDSISPDGLESSKAVLPG